MNLIKAYYYLFYKFYNLAKSSPTMFSYDFVAAVTIGFLEIMFLTSLKFYYSEIFNRFETLQFVSFEVLIPLSIIVVVKYFAFIHNENWKIYFKEFDKYSEEQNDNGSLIVIGIVLFVIINLIIGWSLAPFPRHPTGRSL